MKEMPILFNGEMVRAIVEGRKTQTRRPLKQPGIMPPYQNYRIEYQDTLGYGASEGKYWAVFYNTDPGHRGQNIAYKSPFGQPGGVLWVREPARVVETSDTGITGFAGAGSNNQVNLTYLADGLMSDWLPFPHRLKPVAVGHCIANGCYKEACRIKLRVKRVWVERVQCISAEDAKAEGMPDDNFPCEWLKCLKCNGDGVHGALGYNMGVTEIDCCDCDTVQKQFRIVWNSIYTGSWDRNDWVWCCEFEWIK